MAAVSGNCCNAKLRTPPRHITNITGAQRMTHPESGALDGQGAQSQYALSLLGRAHWDQACGGQGRIKHW